MANVPSTESPLEKPASWSCWCHTQMNPRKLLTFFLLLLNSFFPSLWLWKTFFSIFNPISSTWLVGRERCSDAYSPCIFQTNNRLVLLQLLALDTELELLYSDTFRFWSLDKEVGHNIVSDSRGGDIFPVEKVHKESKYIGDHSLQKMIGCHVTFVSPPPSSLSQCSISSLTKSKIGCMQEEKGRKKEIVVCVRKSRLFQGPHSSLFFRPR